MFRKFLVLAAAASLSTSAPAADAPSAEWATKPVPIELFAQFPQIQRPRISPDGKWIATKVRAGGQQVLAIIPVGDPTAKAELIAKDGETSGKDQLGERQIVAWRWIDSDNLIVTLRYRDNFEGQWFDNTRFVAYNRENKRSVPLGWDGAIFGTELLWQSTEGPPHVLIQRVSPANGTERLRTPEVVDVDVRTGSIRVVQHTNPIVSGWEADEAGVVRFGESYDRDTGKLHILYRPSPGADFRTVVNQTQDRYGDVNAPSLILKNGKAYTVSRTDGYAALYEYDLATMKQGRRVFGAVGYDISAPVLNPARDAIDGVEVVEQRGRAIWFDARLKAIQALLEETYGKGDVGIESADNKREKIVFRVAATGQVPSFYLYDTMSGAVGRLGWWNDKLKDARLNPVSVVHYPASDGKSVEAVLTMPRHRAGEKKLPLIVLPHGGPWARDDADWDPFGWAQALAEIGYVVIQPNYRGSTGYGRDWEKASDRSWGYRMQDDLNDAVTYLAAQGTVDRQRVCMMGWSYGGYAAARAAERDGDKYRCAIIGAGPTDMPSMVNYDKNYLGAYGARTALGSASSNLAEISPALHADKVSIPVLIVHGAHDQRVPVAQSRGFVTRLKRAGKVEGRDYVYLEQPLNTHNLLREADRVEFLKTVQAFLIKNNPA